MAAYQTLQDAIHHAMYRCGTASQYFAMAWVKEPASSGWPLEMATEELAQAADALGYDLVKREAVKVEEAA